MPRLQVLDLRGTAITALPAVALAPTLKVLDLCHTPLTTLPPWLADATPRLQHLRLSPGLALDATGAAVLERLHARGVVR
jgi:Leucine-rich repeat (LRR) protein